MLTDPAKKIINRIKLEQVVPATRFRLQWKHYLFWILWLGLILIGALFFSLMILELFDLSPMFFFRLLHVKKFFFLFIVTAPYLWIGLAILALVSGLVVLRRTKRGYRLNLLFMTTVGVLGIAVLGMGLHMFKINERFEQGLAYQMPHHPGPFFPMENGWKMPDDGLLGGSINELQADYFMLEAFQGGVWKVKFDDQTRMKLHKPLHVGLRVGVVGEKIGTQEFHADIIRGFRPRPDMQPIGGAPAKGMPPPPDKKMHNQAQTWENEDAQR